MEVNVGGPLFLLVMLALYFLPLIVAACRRHHQSLAIFMLNLVAGWTLIGWCAALIWACTAVRADLRRQPATKWRWAK